MRYHEGLGVGHVHMHQPSASSIPHEPRDIDVSDESSDIDVSDNPIPEQLPGGGDMQAPDMKNEQNDEMDDPEMVLEDHENESWEDAESNDSEDGNKSDDQSSEDDGQ